MATESGPEKKLLVVRLGRTKYAEAWEVQKKIFTARTENTIPDILLLTEHDHVYTLGKSSDANHILDSEEELKRKGIDIFAIDRGGDVTYHGPGQVVGYPIIDLAAHYQDIHRYLRDIEEVIIRLLDTFGIKGERSVGYTGVWIGDEKIAAIGVKVSRWITMHGFALNVGTDLSYFDRIIPCGIFHKGITTLNAHIVQPVDPAFAENILIEKFSEIFNLHPEEISPEKMFGLIADHHSVTDF